MRHLSTILMCCLFLCLVSLAAAFPVIWTKTTPASSGGKIVRDTSGNFYHVTRTASLLGRHINIAKYNALGTVLPARATSS